MLLQESLSSQGKWLLANRWVSLILLAIGYFILVCLPFYPGKFYFRYIKAENGYENLCLIISLFGLIIRAYIKGYAPEADFYRAAKGQVQGKFYNTGAYSMVRHPLKMADFIIWMGFVLVSGNFTFIVVFMLSYLFYMGRLIMAQETILMKKFGFKYSDYAKITPALFPDVYLYKKSEFKYSFKKSLNTGIPGLITILGVFFTSDFLLDNSEVLNNLKQRITFEYTLLYPLVLLSIVQFIAKSKDIFQLLLIRFREFK